MFLVLVQHTLEHLTDQLTHTRRCRIDHSGVLRKMQAKAYDEALRLSDRYRSKSKRYSHSGQCCTGDKITTIGDQLRDSLQHFEFFTFRLCQRPQFVHNRSGTTL